MELELTEGAIALIAGGEPSLQPTLQVMELKKVATKQPQLQCDRFRLLLSDGSHLQQAMLGTGLNKMVQDGKLRTGSVVQLKQYTCSTIQGKTIFIVLELVVVAEECPIIGNPVSLQTPLGTPQCLPKVHHPSMANAYKNPQPSAAHVLVLDDDDDSTMNIEPAQISREQIQRLQEENTRLRERCGNREKIMTMVADQNQRLTEENKRLHEKYGHLEENLSQVIVENQRLTKENTRLYERCGRLEKNMSQVIENCKRSLEK